MLELALTKMCGPAQKDEKICFSIPSGDPNNQSDVIYHERTIAQILEAGYPLDSGDPNIL